ncbi:hypothetical protein Tco_0490423 [Tanacetum coccineum]
MSTTNQQSLAESRASDRPSILEKGSYVPWASWFLRFLNNKREEGELMRHTIDEGPYKRKQIPDSNNDIKTILESISKIPSYSHSPQPYYVTHPSSVLDYEDDYQGKIQRDAKEDKLTTTMMLLARAITQRYSTPTNIRLSTISNTRNQAWVLRTDSTLGKINVQCYNCNGKVQYARDCPIPRVRDAKYFREQMLLATKDEARVHLDEEENDFMLDNAYGDNTLKELSATVIMMARIQPTDDKFDDEPTYDVEMLKKQKAFLQKELKTCKEWVKEFEKKPVQFSNYKEAYEEFQQDINVEKENIEKLYNEKEEIREQVLKSQDETLRIKDETKSFKKAFKVRENKYLDDIVTLEEKLKSQDQIVFKMSHSL